MGITNPSVERIIVCAAIRKNDIIVCGARHGNCLNSAVSFGLYDLMKDKQWECGFVDQDNTFLTRAEAWKVADAAGQIRRPTGYERNYNNQRKPNIGDDGLLFSENLY